MRSFPWAHLLQADFALSWDSATFILCARTEPTLAIEQSLALRAAGDVSRATCKGLPRHGANSGGIGTPGALVSPVRRTDLLFWRWNSPPGGHVRRPADLRSRRRIAPRLPG